jgi:hypothetical protein
MQRQLSEPAEAAVPAPPEQFQIAAARNVIRVASGGLRAERTSLFSVFRDEMFFAPAFFDHYRAIGVEQFLVLDDGSTDGTREFLMAQPDCVLLASDLRYGQEITFLDAGGGSAKQRAGIYFKMAIPRAFLDEGYVIYVDADEFLLLPPGVTGVGEVIARLAARGDACCVASIVEFFPETVAGLRAGAASVSLAELIAAYGWFQPEPVVEIDAAGFPQPVGRSKSARLFQAHGVRLRQRGLRKRLRSLFAPEYRASPQFKTPIFRSDEATFLTGTHKCNRPAPSDLLLTIAHFVFTAQFEAKVNRALEWRSYFNGSDKYEHYARLLRALARGRGILTDAHSVCFTSTDQFVAAGLMRW